MSLKRKLRKNWGLLDMSYNLWNDCPKVPITELLSFIVDNRGKTVPTAEKGHKLIATNCVTNNTLFPVYEKVRYLSEETYQNWFRAHPLPGDILFVNKGTPGRVCMVPDPVDFCIAQDMIALRADDSKIYNKYLFAVLRSNVIQQQIYNTNVGDVIPHFKKQFMDQLLIPVPDRKIQEAIGDLYYVLSYKAELNKQINDNLEQQAAALITRYQATTDTSIVLSEIMDFENGFAFQSSTYLAEGTYRIITIKNVQDGRIDSDGAAHIDDLPTRMKSSCSLRIGDALLSLTGNVGRVGIVCENNLLLNQRVAKIVPHNPDLLPFLYFVYRLPSTKIMLEAIAKGTAQLNLSPVETLKLSIPFEHTTAIQLSHILEPIYRLIAANNQESIALKYTRDTLLPKLMSGEVDVSDIKFKPLNNHL